MGATQIVLDVFFVIVIGLMFAIMVFAAKAADTIKKSSGYNDSDDLKSAHKSSTIAAVISGVAVGVLIIIIVVQFV